MCGEQYEEHAYCCLGVKDQLMKHLCLQVKTSSSFWNQNFKNVFFFFYGDDPTVRGKTDNVREKQRKTPS